jgi:hypothetical protein
MPQIPRAPAAAPPPAPVPHFAPPAFAFQPPPVAAPPAAPAAAGMPKYLVAMLAIMGFLVIALLIILIFVLMRHK